MSWETRDQATAPLSTAWAELGKGAARRRKPGQKATAVMPTEARQDDTCGLREVGAAETTEAIEKSRAC